MNKYPTQRVEDVRIGALLWLAGKWLGVIGNSAVEEYWSAPAGGSLVGVFRWLEADSVRFYEILVIEEEAGGLVMRIKHFDPGLKGWEEKEEAVRFDLVQIAEQEAIFFNRQEENPEWLIYRQDASHKLVAYFEKPAHPPVHDQKFRFTRVDYVADSGRAQES